ncbi:DNA/RNA non-specific endonuclease [Steroidobacter flavus]|uniref:Serine protease n=1 Tax=Steroidobacter flavus TaxID=1842136 RepID=A0ABV8T0B2_9GAMM
MKFPEHIERAARARVAIANKQIENSLTQARKGVPLAAEPDHERLISRLQAKAGLSYEEAEMIAQGAASSRGRAALEGGAEKIYGKTIDFVGVSFLERGFVSARAVARVAYRTGQPLGTGFMVSDRLFLTNNHVIATAEAASQLVIEFDYELDPQDRLMGVTRFALAPTVFFQTDEQDDLDFTLVAVGPRIDGNKELSSFGWCQMSDASDKHALGEWANIVQHPDGRYKEVVLRENRLVSRLDTVLHYVADTEPGSSGSPVFNNEWLVIAIHHWGGPWRQKKDEQGRSLSLEVNEGIRASSIVKDLKSRQRGLGPAQQLLLEQMFKMGESRRPPRAAIVDATRTAGVDQNLGPQMASDGSAVWRFPVEVSVRLPWGQPASPNAPTAPASVPDTIAPAASEAKVKPSSDYGSRSGYKPKFIEGHVVELPALTAQQRQSAARNREAESGDDPFELKYHHFSIVMNKKRRLAFFTACNIDGKRSKHVDRDSGVVTPLDVNDPAIERLDPELAEGAEASESWYDDKRLDPSEYAGSDVYSKQVVPGFPDTSSMARTLRMFQRGHLVRRMDPAWGTDKQALLADADTFHWTNCSPQVGFFNMGRGGSFHLAGTERGKLWRAIENYVLRNARAENQKVSVFSGPVFLNNDRKFRTIQVPGRFWKIVVWAEGAELRSLAMIADQRPVISVWPETLGESVDLGQEAFGDPDEIEKVDDFLTTVAEIENLTKLNFGDNVREGDIRTGEEALAVEKLEDVALSKSRPRRSPARKKRR